MARWLGVEAMTVTMAGLCLRARAATWFMVSARDWQFNIVLTPGSCNMVVMQPSGIGARGPARRAMRSGPESRILRQEAEAVWGMVSAHGDFIPGLLQPALPVVTPGRSYAHAGPRP
jgi:hypothetical protein